MPSSERGGIAAMSAAGFAFQRETAALRPAVQAVIACVLGERRDHPDVEDCAAETIRRALEGSARLRDGEPVRPWLLGIARHVAIDARRRRRRERALGEPISPDDEMEPLVERLPDPAPAPDERAASTERARRIAAAMETLARPQREAMMMFHVEGEGYQQIADRLGVPIGTVATWLSRGRRMLADALAETVEQ
ncbi:RNA polymerase sigma factor [Minicystis rosea]|nr:RNA polymerase sigma factor [Minicystis rosea]